MDIVIETPKGSAQKYSYDPVSGFFRLKKILPGGMVFPYDFGFIPDTKGGDGDPLDVVVISEFTGFPGCMIGCRIIGGLKVEQSEKKDSVKMIRNDRFIAIPEESLFFKDVKKMKDLPDKAIEEMEEFFIQYNKLEGKKFKVIDKIDAKEAMELIETGVVV